MSDQEKPLTVFHEIYPEQVKQALIALFNPEIQKFYYITGWAQMPDGMWVVRLRRKIFPNDERMG